MASSWTVGFHRTWFSFMLRRFLNFSSSLVFFSVLSAISCSQPQSDLGCFWLIVNGPCSNNWVLSLLSRHSHPTTHRFISLKLHWWPPLSCYSSTLIFVLISSPIHSRTFIECLLCVPGTVHGPGSEWDIKINNLLLESLHSSKGKLIRCKK